jgi:hypothetical protein
MFPVLAKGAAVHNEAAAMIKGIEKCMVLENCGLLMY